MKLESFMVQDRHGRRPVMGRRLSAAFAYTPDIGDRGPDDTTTTQGPLKRVTHLPTGLLLFEPVPSLAVAKKLVAACEALEGVDWLEDDQGKLAAAIRKAVGGFDTAAGAWLRRVLEEAKRPAVAPEKSITEQWLAKVDKCPEWRGAEIVGTETMALAEPSGHCTELDCVRDHVYVSRTRKGLPSADRRHAETVPVIVIRHPEGATMRLRLTEAQGVTA